MAETSLQILIIFFLGLKSYWANAQKINYAGFCTISNKKPNSTNTTLENKKLILYLARKTPLTRGDKKKDNIVDYQSSLDTNNLFSGADYEIKKMQLVLAYQQHLNQNKNEFIAEKSPIDSIIKMSQSTNDFMRSGDLLFHISNPIKLFKKLKLPQSLLTIYHLTNHKFTNLSGFESEIKDWQGLTLNGNAFLDYKIKL